MPVARNPPRPQPPVPRAIARKVITRSDESDQRFRRSGRNRSLSAGIAVHFPRNPRSLSPGSGVQIRRNRCSLSTGAGTYTRIMFRVGEEDARGLAKGLASFEAEDLMRLGLGEAICRVGGRENDFNLRTDGLRSIDQGEAREHREEIRRRSALRWGTAVDDRGHRPAHDHETRAPAAAPEVEATPPAAPSTAQTMALSRRRVSAEAVCRTSGGSERSQAGSKSEERPFRSKTSPGVREWTCWWPSAESRSPSRSR